MTTHVEGRLSKIQLCMNTSCGCVEAVSFVDHDSCIYSRSHDLNSVPLAIVERFVLNDRSMMTTSKIDAKTYDSIVEFEHDVIKMTLCSKNHSIPLFGTKSGTQVCCCYILTLLGNIKG